MDVTWFLRRARALTFVLLLIAVSSARSTAAPSAQASHHKSGNPLFFSRTVSSFVAHQKLFDDASEVARASARELLTTPKISDVEGSSTRVEPVRILTEFRAHREAFIAPAVIQFSPKLAPGQRKVLRPAVRGERVVTERVTTWDSVVVDRQLLTSVVTKNPRPARVLEGAPRTFAQYAASARYSKLISVMTLVATAYTAATATAHPTGYTATGIRARYGVVAVDPRVIPLGSHVFIPGYGIALAADTGGAIIGNRIDLCMDSWSDAMSFGRQIVQVYILKE